MGQFDRLIALHGEVLGLVDTAEAWGDLVRRSDGGGSEGHYRGHANVKQGELNLMFGQSEPAVQAAYNAWLQAPVVAIPDA